MRQIRVGDRVKAFLDANITGEVTEIFYKPTMGGMLMLGGVPPMQAFARILKSDGQTYVVRTTELSHISD